MEIEIGYRKAFEPASSQEDTPTKAKKWSLHIYLVNLENLGIQIEERLL